MPRLAAVIAYQGTHYAGWQLQPDQLSIQEVLQKSFYKLLRQPISVIASGRTDAGVHAIGQVVHFDIPIVWPVEKLVRGINFYLPADIRMIRACQVPENFHARKSALRKTYLYTIQQGPCWLPQLQATSLWVKKTLDHQKMAVAMKSWLGMHDFSIFCAKKGYLKNPYRTIFELELLHETVVPSIRLLMIRITGDGFFKQMVRSMVGTLLEIGLGKKSPVWSQQILQTKNRAKLGMTVAPQGLTLHKVYYDIEI